jgi:hypothetical protein
MTQMSQGRATDGPPSQPWDGELRAAVVVACSILSLIPPLLTAFLVWRYTVDVPIIDQWSMTEDLRAFYAGEWGIADLVRSHNGHRLLMSRLILVPLAVLTEWNIRAEVMLNLLAAGALLLVLVAGIRPLSANLSWRNPRLLLSATGAALAVFSLAQWENWLWGVQLQVYLAVLFAIAALVALSASRLRWGMFALAMTLALLASFSQGPGLVAWPAGVLLLAVHPDAGGRHVAMLAGWTVAAAGLLWFYLQDLPGDAGAGSVSRFILDDPVQVVVFVLTMLGAPVASFTGSAWPPETSLVAPVGGAALIGASGAFAWRLGRHRSADLRQLLFPLAVTIWAVGVAGQVALGRAQFGLPAAMASRYVTLMAPAWAVTIALGVCVAWSDRGDGKTLRALGGAWALAAYLGLLVSSISALPYFPSRNALLEPAKTALAEGGPEELLARLHPEVQQVYQGLEVLRDHRLSVYRERKPKARSSDALSTFEQHLVARNPPERLPPGSRLTLSLEVENPSQETWPPMHQSPRPVNLSYHWLPRDGGETIADGIRTALPSPLRPGESVVLEAEVETPRTEGSYILRFTMVQEHVDWFHTRGAEPLDLSVTIVGDLPAPTAESP